MDRREYYFADASRDAFRILLERGPQTLLIFLLFWMSGSLAHYMRLNTEMKALGWLVTLPNSIFRDCLAIALVVFVANYFEDHGRKRLVIDTVKEKIIPLLITNFMLSLILGLAILGGGLVIVGLLSLIFKGVGAAISILFTIAITVFIAVKFAFITQGVVTRDAYYADAINHSMDVAKGRGVTIFAIIIIPELVTMLPQYFLEEQIAAQPLLMSIGLGLIVALTTIYNVAAISSLYYNVDDEKAHFIDGLSYLEEIE